MCSELPGGASIWPLNSSWPVPTPFNLPGVPPWIPGNFSKLVDTSLQLGYKAEDWSNPLKVMSAGSIANTKNLTPLRPEEEKLLIFSRTVSQANGVAWPTPRQISAWKAWDLREFFLKYPWKDSRCGQAAYCANYKLLVRQICAFPDGGVLANATLHSWKTLLTGDKGQRGKRSSPTGRDLRGRFVARPSGGPTAGGGPSHAIYVSRR